jgi:hypothetical protein
MSLDDRPTFLLWRIVGNDLPPRHQPGATLTNIRFILAHEPELASCEKRWLLNRIIDPHDEAALRTLLDSHRAIYSIRRFDPDTVRLSPSRYERILHAIDINGARNETLDRGRSLARYTIPLDGNNFFTAAAWDALTEVVRRRDRDRGLSTFAIPMARASSRASVLDPAFAPDAADEPQLAFRDDSPLRFDETFRYGFRDKTELLMRLGRTPGFLFGVDAGRHRYSENDTVCPDAGYVVRLPSAPDDGHDRRDKERVHTREASLDAFLAHDAFRLPPAATRRTPPAVLEIPGSAEPAIIDRALEVLLGDRRAMNDIPPATVDLPREDLLALYACAAYGVGTGSIVHLGPADDGAYVCLEAGGRRADRTPVARIPVRAYPRIPGQKEGDGLAHVRARTWVGAVRFLCIDGARSFGDLMDEVFAWARHLEPGGLIALAGLHPDGDRNGGRRFHKDWFHENADIESVYSGRGLSIVRPIRPLTGPTSRGSGG